MKNAIYVKIRDIRLFFVLYKIKFIIIIKSKKKCLIVSNAQIMDIRPMNA
jgi:hypothetical protein